jgi:hypothetical protein
VLANKIVKARIKIIEIIDLLLIHIFTSFQKDRKVY